MRPRGSRTGDRAITSANEHRQPLQALAPGQHVHAGVLLRGLAFVDANRTPDHLADMQLAQRGAVTFAPFGLNQPLARSISPDYNRVRMQRGSSEVKREPAVHSRIQTRTA